MAIATGTAILGGALLGGVASMASSKQASSAAGSAAATQSAAADRATALQREMYYQSRTDALRQYEQGRADIAPWRTAGVGALGTLQNELGNYAGYVKDPSSYLQSPGYDWQVQQGVNAIDRGASATGKLDSGQRSKDLMAYGQGMAAQDYGNFLGRYSDLLNKYSGIAGTGMTSAGQMGAYGQNLGNQLGQYGQNYATGAGNSMMAGGNAMAGGMINAANARTGMYSNLSQIGSNAANQYSMMNYLQQPSYTGSGYSSNPYNIGEYGTTAYGM